MTFGVMAYLDNVYSYVTVIRIKGVFDFLVALALGMIIMLIMTCIFRTEIIETEKEVLEDEILIIRVEKDGIVRYVSSPRSPWERIEIFLAWVQIKLFGRHMKFKSIRNTFLLVSTTIAILSIIVFLNILFPYIPPYLLD